MTEDQKDRRIRELEQENKELWQLLGQLSAPVKQVAHGLPVWLPNVGDQRLSAGLHEMLSKLYSEMKPCSDKLDHISTEKVVRDHDRKMRDLFNEMGYEW